MTSESNIAASIRRDLFHSIPFEKRSGSKGVVEGIDLDGHFVFKWLVQEVWDHACKSVVTANPSKFYTTKALFNDPDGWKELEKQFHIAAGRCIAYFERRKMLPLHCVNPGESNRRYVVCSAK